MLRLATITLLSLVTPWVSRAATDSRTVENRYTVITMKVEDAALYADYRRDAAASFERAGGRIVREFDVVGEPQGSLLFGEANRVLLLAFDSLDGATRLQADPDYQAVRPLLDRSATHLKVFAGVASRKVTGEPGTVYVLKISNFREGMGERGRQEAAAINRDIGRYDFHEEAVIQTDHIRGLPRAEEVGLFYYGDPEGQARLYEDQASVDRIGAFNQEYLDEFVYLSLTPRIREQ